MTHRIGPGYESLRIGQSDCLNCGKPITGVGVLTRDAPRLSEGDIMVCMYCSHIMEWKAGKLAKLSDEAIKDIAGDKDVMDAVAFSTAFQRFRKGKAT
jgi:hypothetical protein